VALALTNTCLTHARQSESKEENSSKREDNDSEVSAREAKPRRKSEGDSANDVMDSAQFVRHNNTNTMSMTTRKRMKKETKTEPKPAIEDEAKEERDEDENEADIAAADDEASDSAYDNELVVSTHKTTVLIRGGSTYVPFEKVREENERRRQELDALRKKRRKSTEIDEESVSEKPKRKGRRGLTIKVGSNVACRAPEDVDEYYWIAKGTASCT
jgi:hypothetical protein